MSEGTDAARAQRATDKTTVVQVRWTDKSGLRAAGNPEPHMGRPPGTEGARGLRSLRGQWACGARMKSALMWRYPNPR